MRGLDALTVLNLRGGATVSEIVHEIRLPRTTVYRIMETLCNSGFVYRDAADERYRLTVLVRGLSGGFDDESWVTQTAKPMMLALCRDIVWPAAIATLSGTTMMVRETTDHSSPLAIDRYSAGYRVPLLTTATGRAYLAHCAPSQQETLIDILARSAKEDDRMARSRPELQRDLQEIRRQGYATATRTRRAIEENTLSVPILLEDRVLASVTARFAASAVTLDAAVQRFLPKLRDCAAEIRRVFSEQQTETRRSAHEAASRS
jgi:IclR family mhp operon transcriptional activator